MRSVFALIRADGLATLSYRLQTLLSLGGLLFSIVPLYFIAGALQPVMAKAIASEGQQYFAFVVVGTIAYLLLMTTVGALPEAIRSGIGRGTLEAMLATPTPLPFLVTGMVGFPLLWTALRAGVVLISAWFLGAHVSWDRLVPALGILALLVLAHLPFAFVTASLILAFRTPGPFPQGVLTVSALLGGVYYPTQVIPSWLHEISSYLPLTYGLRALRRELLDRVPWDTLAPDVMALLAFVIALVPLSLWLFSWALSHARRAGTLAQY